MNGLFEEKLTVVYCDNDDRLMNLKNDFVKKYPEYKMVQLKKELDPYKHIGPIKVKNNKTILDIVMNDPVIKKYDKNYIISQLKVLGTELFMNRTPSALTTSQKLKICVFLDVFHGEKNFLFDGINDSNKYYYGDVFQFLNQSKEFKGGKAIWFSGESTLDVLDSLGNKTSQYCVYYLAKEGLMRGSFKDYDTLLWVRKVDDRPIYEDKICVTIKIVRGKISVGDTLININEKEIYTLVDYLLYRDDIRYRHTDTLSFVEDRECFMMLPRKTYQHLQRYSLLYKKS